MIPWTRTTGYDADWIGLPGVEEIFEVLKIVLIQHLNESESIQTVTVITLYTFNNHWKIGYRSPLTSDKKT